MKTENFDNSIEKMKHLMTYGCQNESKNTKIKVEDTLKCADGKTYGIVKENHNFFIKVCDEGKSLFTENFKYIGGVQNKMNYAYSSYTKASKQLELKVKSINESYGVTKTPHLINLDAKEELIIEGTEKMRKEIKRQREIMMGSFKIMNEDIGMRNIGNPEAPKSQKFTTKLSTPFDETSDVVNDPSKEHNFKENDYEKAGAPFDEKTKGVKEPKMAKDFKPVVEESLDYEEEEYLMDSDPKIEEDTMDDFSVDDFSSDDMVEDDVIEYDDSSSEELYDVNEEDIVDMVEDIMSDVESDPMYQDTYSEVDYDDSDEFGYDNSFNDDEDVIYTYDDEDEFSDNSLDDYIGESVKMKYGDFKKMMFEAKAVLKVPVEKKEKIEIDKNMGNGLDDIDSDLESDDIENDELDDIDSDLESDNIENSEEENPFDKNFDPEVGVDEDEDPKKFIQKLTGKLAQSIRDYNESNDDNELNKFVINSLIPATVPTMSDEDKEDVITKVKEVSKNDDNLSNDEIEDTDEIDDLDINNDEDIEDTDEIGDEKALKKNDEIKSESKKIKFVLSKNQFKMINENVDISNLVDEIINSPIKKTNKSKFINPYKPKKMK